MEKGKKLAIGFGVLGVGTALALILASRAKAQPPDGFTIEDIVWNGGGRAIKYNGDVAEFTITINSAAPYEGKLTIASPGFICPVRLWREAQWQAILNEIQLLIDDYEARGLYSTAAFWSSRLAMASRYPSQDGYRVDLRWYDEDQWYCYEEAGNPCPRGERGNWMEWDISFPEGLSEVKGAFLIPGYYNFSSQVINAGLSIVAGGFSRPFASLDIYEMKFRYLW